MFSIQTLVKADDIKDFEIERMSVGSNVLDFFSKKQLEMFYNSYGNDHDGLEVYQDVVKTDKRYFDLEFYDGLQVSYTKNSEKFYKIISIAGLMWFKDNIEKCLETRKLVKVQIKDFLMSSIIDIDDKENNKRKHNSDETGKSFTYDTTFLLKDKNEVRIDCYDWSPAMGYWDHLRVGIITKEYSDLVDRDYNK
jgi:hypothetical protein